VTNNARVCEQSESRQTDRFKPALTWRRWGIRIWRCGGFYALWYIAGILWLGTFVSMAQVQEAQLPPSFDARRDGGIREVLESIVIPPIPGAPFTAILVWVHIPSR
jgi:hypothetical protein